MDVTFTNVLEGARQYFQGLPAASGSAASPSSTISYGVAGPSGSAVTAADHATLVQQQQQQATPPTNRPPSQQQQQQYHYPQHSYPQYPAASHHETVLQYSYPARSSTTSYHQLQPPRHHTPSTSYSYQQPQAQPQPQQQPQQQQQQQQAKPYYPPAVPQSQTYTVPPSTQPQTQQSYHQFTSHSYSPHTYQSTNKTPEHHRTTHNLPPIAALSSANYHSNKSNREPVRLSSHRQTNHSRNQTATSATATVSVSAPSSRVPVQYPQSYDTNTYHASSSQNGPTTYPSYPSASSQAYTCATTTTPNYSTTSSTVSAYSQSSYPQHFQKVRTQEQKQPQYQSSSKDYHYQSNSMTNHAATSVLTLKHKRESPLDLSVKTVRTPADSTALDEADVHVRSMPPPMQVPYDHNQRSTTVRTTTATTGGAPKVDFLPNFNVSTLHGQRTDNTRQIIQQNDKNNINSRNMSYSTKVYYQQHQHQQQQLQQQQYQQQQQQQSQYHYQHYNNNTVTNSTHPVYNTAQVPQKRSDQLPRIDFPTHNAKSVYTTSTGNVQRKRPAEPVPPVPTVPSKIPKMDTWRQTIDQQIEQRLNSYANSKKHLEQQAQLQYTQQAPHHHIPQQHTKPVNNVTKTVVNGNVMSNHHRSREMYATYTQNHASYPQTQQYNNNNQYHQQNHNQTYVPTAMGQHHYPPNHSQQDMYQQSVLQRTNSNPKLVPTSPVRNNNLGGADKRVLSILRNSLEIKGAKEAQKKLEHTNHMRQPSTDVTAPLQPKPGIIGRQNVSPFPATNLLERNSNTPPIYKFHFPRAVDSVRFETETVTKDNPVQTAENNAPIASNSNPSDLDGLAAFLAARIRTKAELKQVGSNQIQQNVPTTENTNNSSVPAYTNNANIPKLMKDKAVFPPRRRLFSRSEEENLVIVPSSSSCAPVRDSAIRSSSETSVFDFRDSDSEGEISVLERQSLDDMRRDRKSMNKPQLVVPVEEIAVEIKIEEDLDPFWSDTCDKFLEQLKINGGKKRGRRKKFLEPEVIAKLEIVTKENPIDNINLDAVVKLENIDHLQKTEPEKPPKTENDSDSDVPLARKKPLKGENGSDGEDSNLETRKEKVGAKVKLEYSSDSSDSDSETIQSVSDKLKKLKAGSNKDRVLRSADSSPKKINPLMKKKAIFGDGSDFHPGWEEEVYKYKRSLRMPARLINITRTPHWHRISTSLPDLDPCSPTASSITDDLEFSMNISRRSMPSFSAENSSKIKRDLLDSDMDSNSSFTFSYQKAYDSEEASCSSLKSSSNKNLKNKENNNILDVLVERYSKFKRKKLKGKEQKLGPKIIPRSTNPLELLPTPSLGIGSPEKEVPKPRGRPKLNKEPNKEDKTDSNSSVYLGFFRKETVNNFRDTFKKNSGFMGMGEPFSTVVLKSRTRTETRVLKQRATIREVFGEERPASAPPIACRDDDNLDSSQDSIQEKKPQVKKKINLSPTRQGLRSASGRRPNKIYVTKKIKPNRKRNNLIKPLTEVTPIKSETPSIDGDNTEIGIIPTKKRLKLRNMRRKFSSGFDYIRKKKKIVKKEDADGSVKTKRRGMLPRPSPESVQDIQREIKTWVMNKGVGESHLHRAARLGYTDVTAYCLEKMDCIPSPKDNAGYTPLHEACSRGHLDIARLLLQYGANVSESAQGGIRPFHEAVENGFVEIVRLLLSYGADPGLATYSGLTPLSLAKDEETRMLLKYYMADMQGLHAPPWSFRGPAACFDPEESGYDPLSNAPSPEPVPEDEDIEIEMSDQQLPNLYVLRGEPPSDRWILLQDLSTILKIKSRDALLRQINSGASSSSAMANKTILREMKFCDFMEQAHCCTLLCASEKLNARSTKIALVKYTDKVKQLLGVERVVVTSR